MQVNLLTLCIAVSVGRANGRSAPRYPSPKGSTGNNRVPSSASVHHLLPSGQAPCMVPTADGSSHAFNDKERWIDGNFLFECFSIAGAVGPGSIVNPMGKAIACIDTSSKARFASDRWSSGKLSYECLANPNGGLYIRAEPNQGLIVSSHPNGSASLPTGGQPRALPPPQVASELISQIFAAGAKSGPIIKPLPYPGMPDDGISNQIPTTPGDSANVKAPIQPEANNGVLQEELTQPPISANVSTSPNKLLPHLPIVLTGLELHHLINKGQPKCKTRRGQLKVVGERWTERGSQSRFDRYLLECRLTNSSNAPSIESLSLSNARNKHLVSTPFFETAIAVKIACLDRFKNEKIPGQSWREGNSLYTCRHKGDTLKVVAIATGNLVSLGGHDSHFLQ